MFSRSSFSVNMLAKNLQARFALFLSFFWKKCWPGVYPTTPLILLLSRLTYSKQLIFIFFLWWLQNYHYCFRKALLVLICAEKICGSSLPFFCPFFQKNARLPLFPNVLRFGCWGRYLLQVIIFYFLPMMLSEF